MKINIDEMVEKRICPALTFCALATTDYTIQERELECHLCWEEFCKSLNIDLTK